MPCKDYDTSTYGELGSREIQLKLDMLSRIVCKTLSVLEKIQAVALDDTKNTFNYRTSINEIFNDSEVVAWWSEHKKADAEEQARAKAWEDYIANKGSEST